METVMNGGGGGSANPEAQHFQDIALWDFSSRSIILQVVHLHLGDTKAQKVLMALKGYLVEAWLLTHHVLLHK